MEPARTQRGVDGAHGCRTRTHGQCTPMFGSMVRTPPFPPSPGPLAPCQVLVYHRSLERPPLPRGHATAPTYDTDRLDGTHNLSTRIRHLLAHHASSMQTRTTCNMSLTSTGHQTECLRRSSRSQGSGWSFSGFYLVGSGSQAGTACPAVQQTPWHPQTHRLRCQPSSEDLCDNPGSTLR